jgi:AcrR family transcriptional regulator
VLERRAEPGHGARFDGEVTAALEHDQLRRYRQLVEERAAHGERRPLIVARMRQHDRTGGKRCRFVTGLVLEPGAKEAERDRGAGTQWVGRADVSEAGIIGNAVDRRHPADRHHPAVGDRSRGTEDGETGAHQELVPGDHGTDVGAARIEEARGHHTPDVSNRETVSDVEREPAAHAGPEEQQRALGVNGFGELDDCVDPVAVLHRPPVGYDGVAVAGQIGGHCLGPELLRQHAERRQHPAVPTATVQHDHGGDSLSGSRMAVEVQRRAGREWQPLADGLDDGRGGLVRHPPGIPLNMRIIHIRECASYDGAMQRPARMPQQDRSRRRVAAILDAAAHEFAEHGFAGTTTTAVAARAGVPIGSLYQWFPDKEALIYGLADRHLSDGAATMLAALERAEAAPDLASSVQLMVEAAVDANSGDPRVHRILYREAPRPPDLQARLGELQDALTAWVAGELTRRGVAHGAKARLRARTLVLAVEALVHELVIEPPTGVTRRAAIREVTTVALAMATA